MSGTSMDGLDMCLSKIHLTPEYKFSFKIVKTAFSPFDKKTKQIIIDALKGNSIDLAHNHLGALYAELCRNHFKNENIDAVAMHGQTIAHKDGEMTQQIGNPQFLKESFQIPIIFDFRQNDIAENGNGAPLMPLLDWLLFKDNPKHNIVLNIGGIANISYIPPKANQSDVVGFDTGPGMSLIDELCTQFFNKSFDTNGELSSKGNIDNKLLHELMMHPFIRKEYPKSTGRHEFGSKFVHKVIQQWNHLSHYDILRIFVSFTAKSIWENILLIRNFTPRNWELIVSGGGVLHPILMSDLEYYTSQTIKTSNDVGIKPEFKEGLLMSVLGAAKLMELPANMPTVTGAKKHVSLGRIL